MSTLWTPRCGAGRHLRISSLRVGATLPSESRAWGGVGLGLWLLGDVGPEAEVSCGRETVAPRHLWNAGSRLWRAWDGVPTEDAGRPISRALRRQEG